MLPIAAGSVAPCAGRDLIRPPSYAWLAENLTHLEIKAGLYDLWRAVLGEQQPAILLSDSIYTLEAEFIKRVDARLFPIDLVMIEEIWWSDEVGPLDYPIPIPGFRIPWEMEPAEDLPPYQQAIAECLAANRLGSGDPAIPWLVEDPASVRGAEDAQPEVGAALATLAALTVPLNALADLVRLAILGPFDNPFLDHPPSSWLEDYALDVYYWTEENIRYLTERYQEVRDVGERIKAFRNWFSVQPDQKRAGDTITRLLQEAGQ